MSINDIQASFDEDQRVTRKIIYQLLEVEKRVSIFDFSSAYHTCKNLQMTELQNIVADEIRARGSCRLYVHILQHKQYYLKKYKLGE